MGFAKKKELVAEEMIEKSSKDKFLNINFNSFEKRHIGPNKSEQTAMLKELGEEKLSTFISKVLPSELKENFSLKTGSPMSEPEVLNKLKTYAQKNKIAKSFIGMGYYSSHTPPVIQRNILENPAWYTQYTPYQAEISQGRLEALLNFQTVVSDLTGMEFSNASLLDEATALAEAMQMCFKASKSKSLKCLVSSKLHPQSISVLQTRAEPLDIEIIIKDVTESSCSDSLDAYFAVIVQYPNTDGLIEDYSFIKKSSGQSSPMLIAASDLLALTLLKPPGEWGADVVVGSSQRFGIPLWYGGPHAGFFATSNEFKRFIPGRVVGVSKDKFGKKALRLALQVREQHIKRDRATSNICTSQVLLAVAAGMYATYHGAQGLRDIARSVSFKAKLFREALRDSGFKVLDGEIFDTVKVFLNNSDISKLKEES